MSPEKVPELLTRSEAAAALRVSLTTITRLTQSGQLRAVHVGRAIRIPAESIRAFIAGESSPEEPSSPELHPDYSTSPPTSSILELVSRLNELDAEPADKQQRDDEAALRAAMGRHPAGKRTGTSA